MLKNHIGGEFGAAKRAKSKRVFTYYFYGIVRSVPNTALPKWCHYNWFMIHGLTIVFDSFLKLQYRTG